MATPKRISKSWWLPDSLWEVMHPLLPKRQRRSKRGRRPLDLRPFVLSSPQCSGMLKHSS